LIKCCGGVLLISVKINRDIQQYKSKVILNFSLRESVSIAIALAFVVPFHIFAGKHIPNELTSWVEIFIVAPVLLAGFFSYHGMPFEKYVLQIIKSEFLYPKVRKYVSTDEIYISKKKVNKCLRKNIKK